MTDRVYLITDGEYSDYHVERVFDHLQDARAYCREFFLRHGRFPEVEEWAVGGEQVTTPREAWEAQFEWNSDRDVQIRKRCLDSPWAFALEPTPELFAEYQAQGESDLTDWCLTDFVTLRGNTSEQALEKALAFRRRVRELLTGKGGLT